LYREYLCKAFPKGESRVNFAKILCKSACPDLRSRHILLSDGFRTRHAMLFHELTGHVMRFINGSNSEMVMVLILVLHALGAGLA